MRCRLARRYLFGDGIKGRIKELAPEAFNASTPVIRLPRGVFAPYTSINRICSSLVAGSPPKTFGSMSINIRRVKEVIQRQDQSDWRNSTH